MDYTNITLGELLSHGNETIKRNAMSILKTLQQCEIYYRKVQNFGEQHPDFNSREMEAYRQRNRKCDGCHKKGLALTEKYDDETDSFRQYCDDCY